ncbi:bacillithiol biosynthesis cysteine-adding enzyme BshC [Amniculibacterium sp. G2-70]|uniref:bacillithiol biosynthesis cysteine-adding enzyme BshC n=1 Tax=Amniculibacterium sp. G2-70 TaxID=2767188 RepID=UPI0016540406|nr:bacillithiol biosynthesis cysteine-adding enzyme BshC [Amniculibacterium sp. G2-70]
MKALAQIPFQNLESIPTLVKDFLNAKIEGTQSLVWNHENIKNKIESKTLGFSPYNREILSEVLCDQHQDLSLSALQKENLDRLSNKNTLTITTGHQLNLFSGPVFFIYKIAQVIKSTNELNKIHPNHHFVPLFWMATEDHDFEEINHFKAEGEVFSIREESGGAVGRIQVSDLDFIQNFENSFKDRKFGGDLIDLMKSSYKEGETLTQATRKLVHQLFSEYGLLMIDGDDKRLKALMKETFQKELTENLLYKSTQKTILDLKQHYGKVQVNPREINLFYLEKTRNRIEFDGEKFVVVDTSLQFSKEEILNELKNNPEKFSPNAVLRPVFQEIILPNLAYIGGNAEIAYWLELIECFKSINLDFPILVPRNSLLFLSEKTLGKMQKLGLSIEEVLGNKQTAIKTKLLSNHPLESLISEKENELKTIFQELKFQSIHTDFSFGQLINAEEMRQMKSYDRMKKRLLKAEKIKQQEKVSRIENVFSEVHPAGIWQERVWNFSEFYADYGSEWLQDCYNNISIEKSELNVVVYSF